ncbi:MAG: c-type cytochrome [Alcaligenaceae bacterium]|nr:c-type cytochrome [Alcaligenaceae bacterium]
MSVFSSFVLAALGAMTLSTLAYAAPAGLDLARSSQCMACHQVDSRRVGPPFNAVAQRFGDQAGAEDYLAKVIRNGSRGQWGAIPMPAQKQVSEADAKKLAQWILSLSPSAD